MTLTVSIRKLVDDAIVPSFASEGSSGADLYASEACSIAPHTHSLIPTGIAIAMPPGVEAQIRPRSGIALKYGVTVLNTPGTIDADYRGEIKVILINHGMEAFAVTRGMRIAQMVFSRVEKIRFQIVAELERTVRDAGGFGHSGISAAESKEEREEGKGGDG